MPITDYEFTNRIFFARETGDISAGDAMEWAQKLKDHAEQSPVKIVALVDALEVKHVAYPAVDIFSKASFTHKVIAVVVATNQVIKSTARDIGLLGKRNQTVVFRTLDEARQHAEQLVKNDAPQAASSQSA